MILTIPIEEYNKARALNKATMILDAARSVIQNGGLVHIVVYTEVHELRTDQELEQWKNQKPPIANG
jgi:hypothetical protein